MSEMIPETILGSLPGIFYVIDDKGDFVKWNRSFEEVSGYSAQELAGMSALNIFREADQERVAKRIEEVFVKGASDVEADFISKTGSATPYYFTGKAVEMDGTMHLVGMGIDITRQKLLEDEVREKEKQYRLIIENQGEGIGFVDTKECFVFANPAAEKIFGVPPGKLVGRDVTQFLVPEQLAVMREESSKRARAERSTYELDIITHENQRRTLLVTATPEMDEQGTFTGTFGVFRDITIRKQTQAALLESEERFRTIFEQSPIGIELYDADGIQITANRTSFQMFGIEDDSSTGFNLFSGTSLKVEQKKKLRQGETVFYHAEFDFDKVNELGLYRTTRTGRTDMEYIITPIHSGDNKALSGYLLQVQEVTERIYAERLQTVLYNISNAVITTSNLEELIGIIHAQLGILVDTTNFYLAFFDEPTGMLSTPYNMDQNDDLTSWPAEKSMTGYVISQDKSVLINRNEILELVRTGVIDMVGTPAASWLGVPLRMDGRVIGAFVVQSYDDERAYLEKDKEVLEFVSGQIGLSINRKQIEVSLRESEERFRNLTEAASDAIINIDAKGLVRLFNHAAEEMFGYDAKEIYGRPMSLLVPARFGKIFMKGIDQYLETGKSTILGRVFQFKGKRKNGSIFPLEISLSEVRSGGETNFIGIVRDITHRKRTEMQIQEFTTALQESNITKDKFFSIIAHDLKSPFNAILGLTNALIDDYKSLDEKRIAGLLNTIKTSSERAFELLENLLAWANAQTGQIVYKPQQVSL
ncbi:MAG: PAS domain S-box protein, partial [Bacteroidales bacterium]|nr:PAS domain S-box protein [Bacteroidales bacterium]